jgi:phosphoribosyl-ATP pyrophosphohydrolase/phosphoribosyl-AMP cyclohydrolase
MNTINRLTFDEQGLIPAVVQDHRTGEVLMLAYMNAESLERTIAAGETHFWSRSRNRLWRKGETSGNTQAVAEIRFDCDADALLVRVRQNGVACHTGERSCFHRTLVEPGSPEPAGRVGPEILDELFAVIQDRRENPPPNSYTAELFSAGVERVLKKVGEEAAEVIIAAMGGARDEIVYESADLLYHLLVLLAAHGIEPEAMYEELLRRRSG